MPQTDLVIRPGVVVVLEGLDRTGKSTQLERLRAAVGDGSTVFAHMPSGFTTFTKSVHMALEGATVDDRPTSGLAQQLAHLACHAESIRELERAVEMQSLILDRWWWSTLAYGWYGGSVEQSGLSEGSFRELIKTIWSPIAPSVVFVFLEPHHVDVNNTEGVEVGYRTLIEEHSDLAVVVPSGSEESTYALITASLLERGLAYLGQARDAS
ncbi:MAG: hypothetical protein KF808_00375 [Cryobacterium sp.]|nr:hypothetical protein [Cryobacterium sp.]